MQAKQAHLEMIQAIINRMATNSFHLKGWSVTLTSALFAFGAKDADRIFVLLAYFPIVAFWLLDAFFLHQEKRFRALYDHVRALPDDKIDFSMHTAGISGEVRTVHDVVFSKTLLLFHGVVFVTTVVVMFLMPTGK